MSIKHILVGIFAIASWHGTYQSFQVPAEAEFEIIFIWYTIALFGVIAQILTLLVFTVLYLEDNLIYNKFADWLNKPRIFKDWEL